MHCLQIIIKVPDLVDQLRGLVDKGLAVGPLLALLLPSLADNLLHKKLYTQRALQIVKKLPLGQQHSSILIYYSRMLLFDLALHALIFAIFSQAHIIPPLNSVLRLALICISSICIVYFKHKGFVCQIRL